jgi:retron-type reverse transcriptase
MAVTQILLAIYEVDFLPCSNGYRPGLGAHDAIRTLTRELQFGGHHFVTEADIKGFFENIRWEWLERMLRERVADGALLNLIGKWLRAGILEEDGRVIHPQTGTPQGGIISPVLANIYLHYALDLWFERVVRPQQRGRCRMDKETPSPEAKPDAQDAQPPVSALPDTATADYGKVQCRNALPAGIKFLPTVVELSATDG